MPETLKTELFTLELSKKEWTYTLINSKTISISYPEICIDNDVVKITFENIKLLEKIHIGNFEEYVYLADVSGISGLKISFIIRYSEKSPIIRFKYIFSSEISHKFTKINGQDKLTYLSCKYNDSSVIKEIRFSEFYENIHSYKLGEYKAFEHENSAVGPVIVQTNSNISMLIAYEHGSQYPDCFLKFVKTANGTLDLTAARANYLDGETVCGDKKYETIWFQFGAVSGDEEKLAHEYRMFQLKYATPNIESRKPYIYYNSWAFQERNKWWNKKNYISSMNEERMLAEIDVAHKMGIDVFVLDTGWYEKTGDWRASSERFPRGLELIKERLKSYGMRMGLWFNPTVAGITSNMYKKNVHNVTEYDGKKSDTYEIWETEESHPLCLVSDYWENFAEELIRIYNDWGVTYFKWDAIGQYSCDSAAHNHGTSEYSFTERMENYAFKQVIYMSKIIDKLCSVCPEAIVDFDITESGRSVGLAFLSSGKYFLINNGPYYWSYDIHTEDNPNLFFFPGAARTWICREPLVYDKWIPSILFLTHYLPDDPYSSQIANIGSLILGQNGIWGDLLGISEDGVNLFGRLLSMYKEIRDDITEADPVVYGAVSSSFEVHEKINSVSNRGIIVAFSCGGGRFYYKTKNKISEIRHIEGKALVTVNADGTANIEFDMRENKTCIIFI